MSFSSVVAADSPVVHYRLAETSGTSAADASGNGRTGTYKNAPTLNQGGGLLSETNAAVKFASASKQYVSRASEAALNLGDTFSIMAVIKATAWQGGDAIVGKGGNAYYLRVNAEGELELLKQDVKLIVHSTTKMTAGVWYYVLATKTGATVKLYQAKIEAGSTLADVTGSISNATCENSTELLGIGRASEDEEYFNGLIDEAAVFATALSKARGEVHLAAALSSAVSLTASVAGTSSASAEMTVPTKALMTATAAGTSTAAAVPRVTPRLTASTAGTSSAAGILSVPAPIVYTPRRKKPPLELDVEGRTADGNEYRWDPTSRLASNRPQGLSYSTGRDEGFGPGAAVLTRPVMRDYWDLNLLDEILFIGKNGEIAYEGRNHDFARTNDPVQQFAINFVGWMSTAAGFRKFSEIYVDRVLSRWAQPSLQRQANLIAAGYSTSASASVHSDGAGALPAGLFFDFTGVNKPATGPKVGNEFLYYGGGVDIGKVLYDFIGDGTTPWITKCSIDRADLDLENLGALTPNGATALQQVVNASGPGGKFVFFMDYYTGTGAAFQMTNNHYVTGVAVVGRHGLTFYGVWPNTGPVVSDILEDIFTRFTPLTWDPDNVSTTYPVQQAAFFNTFPFDAAKALNDLHLLELTVYEEKKVRYKPADLTVYDWQIRTDDRSVRFTPLQGDSIDSFANGVEVTFTDFYGRTFTLYPDDHPELRDESESNPANRHGDKLWKDFTVPYPTELADALQMGRAYLAEFNRPKAPGTISIAGGYIRDAVGHWQQGWKVRSGETIALVNHPNDTPRLITGTSWNQDSKTLQVSVDNGFQLLEAFLARMANRREAANLS